MSADSATILGHLHAVEHERERRARDPAFAARVQQVKAYQQRRFALTYADLLASAKHRAVTRFFLDELYGPADFSRRDAQFARVVPALVRLFPSDVVDTVETLSRLHALTEALDSEMALALGAGGADAAPVTTPPLLDQQRYVLAWQRTARPEAREQQIALMLSVGSALDRLTRKPLLRSTLRLMRGAAQAAGLGELQRFLETGFDTFREMGGSADFLALIGQRERALADELFAATADAGSDVGAAPWAGRLP